ncbi:hypothetical protein KA005_50535, partial [bacterium]|nr:hypothetical protein [bacterium]
MKHRKYLLIILLISLGIIVSSTPAALAQYQITAAQYPAIGTASTFEADTTGNITVVIGAGGTGQTWDYTSNLVGLEYQSQFIDPSSQDYAGTFPTAQWAIESYQYLSMDAMPPLLNEPIRGLFTLTYLERLEDNTIYGTGIRTITPFYSGNFPYQQDAIHYPMPLEKGKSWVREANYAAMQVPVEIIPPIVTNIDIHMTDSSYIEVDASGDLTIPLGTFPVLRLKIRRTLTIEIFLSSLPGGDPLYSTVESIIMYEWHTQDA